jgi:hypothetical protein
MLTPFSRRQFLATGLAAGVPFARGAEPRPTGTDVHKQLLALAAGQEKKRREKFAAVQSATDLEALQKELRQTFLALLDGLPDAPGAPAVKTVGRIDADDYTIDKLVLESLPGYFVSALLYLPKRRGGRFRASSARAGTRRWVRRTRRTRRSTSTS